jgi:hypothetical protein
MVELVGREAERQKEIKFSAALTPILRRSEFFRELFAAQSPATPLFGWIFANQANCGGKWHSAKPRPVVAVHNNVKLGG